MILLMQEILHQLIGSLSHYLQGFVSDQLCVDIFGSRAPTLRQFAHCPMSPWFGQLKTWRCFFVRWFVWFFRPQKNNINITMFKLRLENMVGYFSRSQWFLFMFETFFLQSASRRKKSTRGIGKLWHLWSLIWRCPSPYHLCMVYLPTFTMKINHSCR